MTFAQVVKTPVTNNNSFQNYPHPDNHTNCLFYVNFGHHNAMLRTVSLLVSEQVQKQFNY